MVHSLIPLWGEQKDQIFCIDKFNTGIILSLFKENSS